MEHTTDHMHRREFLRWAGARGAGLGLAAAALPTALTSRASAQSTGRAIVGDVEEFALTSNEWSGDFGFVTFKLHKGVFDGKDVYFIRTDASDEAYATENKLVFVPKMAGMIAANLTGEVYLVEGGAADQAAVMSSEPGQDDYTPAWRVNRARWTGSARKLNSVKDVQDAARAGNLQVEPTNVVLNAMAVKWSGGEMAVDTERTQYLGPGQLLEAPDTQNMRVTFKLHECYPGVRYIVVDTSMQGMAEGMKVVHSPRLEGSTGAGATGRTNVFMNGLEGPGPMGFQPSVFDSQAGAPSWSPYWDHMTYSWKDGVDPRLLTDERQIHEARDGGDLTEFVGSPMTDGNIFVVNCPVPVLAENTFGATGETTGDPAAASGPGVGVGLGVGAAALVGGGAAAAVWWRRRVGSVQQAKNT